MRNILELLIWKSCFTFPKRIIIKEFTKKEQNFVGIDKDNKYINFNIKKLLKHNDSFVKNETISKLFDERFKSSQSKLVMNNLYKI